MGKRWTSKNVLPAEWGLRVRSVEAFQDGWIIQVEGNSRARCPLCRAISVSRHSRYWRTIRDLPVQGAPVALRVRLSRWRCRNGHCKRRIFSERIPSVAAPHRQRTERLEEVIQIVGHSLGGRPAERLLARLGMPVSDDTILRQLKSRAAMGKRSSKQLRVIGIDDWAWRKGQNYGTVLVDLEGRRVADLLPKRSAEQVAQWLQQNPTVEIVSRDRFGLYARAAQRGAPQARQVADRFHLLLNLREAVEHELSRQRSCLVIMPPGVSSSGSVTAVPDRASASASRSFSNPETAAHQGVIVAQRSLLDQALFMAVHRLRHMGNNASEIVRQTGISRKRVDKWLRFAELPARNKMAPKPDSPAFFCDYLAKRWSSGIQHVRTLLAELHLLGYTGCFSGLARFLSPWREKQRPVNAVLNNKVPEDLSGHRISPLVAAALLVKPRPLLSAEQQHKVDCLKSACPGFTLMRSLVAEFRGILQCGKPDTLDAWIRKAKDSGVYSFQRFAKTLRRDLPAVHNALTEPFSNGPVEGHINRLKTLKRQMYGRAGFELLRARLLPPAVITSSKIMHQT